MFKNAILYIDVQYRHYGAFLGGLINRIMVHTLHSLLVLLNKMSYVRLYKSAILISQLLQFGCTTVLSTFPY